MKFLPGFGGANCLAIKLYDFHCRVCNGNAKPELLLRDVQGDKALFRFHFFIGFNCVIQQIAQQHTQIQRIEGVVGRNEYRLVIADSASFHLLLF